MHPANYSKPREANESGKFAKVAVAGVHRIDNHGYKSHTCEISSRQVGVTVKRTTYSVSIFGETGEQLTFLADLPSSHAAKKAAEEWIDLEIRRRAIVQLHLQRVPKPKHKPSTPAQTRKPG